DRAAYQNLLAVIDELALTFGALTPGVQLPAVKSTDWSMGWETQLLDVTNKVESASSALRQALQGFTDELGIPREDCSLEELEKFRKLARALLDTATQNYRIIFHKQFAELSQELDRLESSITGLNTAQEKLSATSEIEV